MLLRCRLAAFICGHEVFQISVSSTYGIADFKENLLRLYTKVPICLQTPIPVHAQALYLDYGCEIALCTS